MISSNSRRRRAARFLGWSRGLVEAKGFDILLPVLDRLLADDVRLIILGRGDPAYETALAIAARKYPERLAYRHDYDEALAHLIEGGSDIALIPSRVEPGAFSAMHSLKYGVLPIARATPRGRANHRRLRSFGRLRLRLPFLRIRERTVLGRDQARPGSLCRASGMGAAGQRALALDFSWELAAERYEAFYGELMTRVAAA